MNPPPLPFNTIKAYKAAIAVRKENMHIHVSVMINRFVLIFLQCNARLDHMRTLSHVHRSNYK